MEEKYIGSSQISILEYLHEAYRHLNRQVRLRSVRVQKHASFIPVLKQILKSVGGCTTD